MEKGENLARFEKEEESAGAYYCTYTILIAGTGGSILARLNKENRGPHLTS